MAQELVTPTKAPGSAYARFSRRLRAFLIDAVLFALVFYIGAVVIDSLAFSDANRRLFLLSLAVLILAYDPVLVAFFGATLGHRLTNLRVVDEGHGGNISLLRAIARALIKDVLGWLSFASMAITRRHQALHDVFTHSTVQVRDLTKAQASHFAPERIIEPLPGAPSRTHRVFAIVAYIILAYIGVSVVSVIFISKGCVAHHMQCSGAEVALSILAGATWLAASIVIIIRGWKGRLWGCRIGANVA
jgi:uncharacterized RDD family membrane protein YckC